MLKGLLIKPEETKEEPGFPCIGVRLDGLTVLFTGAVTGNEHWGVVLALNPDSPFTLGTVERWSTTDIAEFTLYSNVTITVEINK